MSSSSTFASEFGSHLGGGGGSSGSFANLFGSNHTTGSSPAPIPAAGKPSGSSGWGPFSSALNEVEHLGGEAKHLVGEAVNPGDVWGHLVHGTGPTSSGGIEGAIQGIPATGKLVLEAMNPFGGRAMTRANTELASGLWSALKSSGKQVVAVQKPFLHSIADVPIGMAEGKTPGQIARTVEHHYGQSLHEFNKDPFQYLTTLATIGAAPAAAEGSAIKGAALADRLGLAEKGGLAGRVGEAAKTAGTRAIKARAPVETAYTHPETGERFPFTAPRARTVQGRILYNPIREAVGAMNEGHGLPFLKGTGNIRRLNTQKLIDWGAQEVMNRLAVEQNQLGAASSKLSSAETFAARHSVEYGRQSAMNAPLGEPRMRIIKFNNDQITKLQADAARIKRSPPRKIAMQQAIRRLQNENKIFTHPRISKEIDQAIKYPSEKMTKALDTGQALHAANEQRLVEMGAIHPDEMHHPELTQGQERRLRPQAQYGGAVYDAGAVNPDATALAEKQVLDRIMSGEPVSDVLAAHQASRQMLEGTWVGGPDMAALAREHPDAGRVPDYPRGAGRPPLRSLPAAGAQSIRSLSPLRKVNAMYQGTGVLRALGRLTTAPDAWNRENLDVGRLEIINNVHQGLKNDKIAIPVEDGKLKPGYSPVNLDGRSLMRSTHEDLAHYGADEAIQRHLGMMTGTETAPVVDAKWQMPTDVLHDLTREINASKSVVARLAQHPLNYWRAAVLKYRPAWLVNNIVGQHLLYLIAHPAGVADYARATRSKNRQLVADEIHGVFQRGSTSLAGGRRAGYTPTFKEYSGVGKVRQGISPLGRPGAWALKTTESPLKLWKGFGNGMLAANRTLADNIPRTAIALRGLREYRTRMAILQGVNEDLMKRWRDHSLAEIAQQMTPAEKADILRQVNRALGDFNLFRGKAGQNLRLVVPFASWFAVIMRITADLGLEYPEKVAFISHMNQIARNAGYGVNFGVPSFDAGAVTLGGPKNGEQPILTMQGLNPFSTVTSLAQSADSLIHGKPADAAGAAGPISLFGPLGQAWSAGVQGIDPFTGRTYTGPGENQGPAGRIAGEIGLNLPQIRLLQQMGVAPGYTPPKSYRDRQTKLGGKNVNFDALERFLGIPVRNVNIAKSREYKKLGY